MKRINLNLVVFIAILASFTGTALAGNSSYGIAVSCTIPAIPGINVPLVEDSMATNTQASVASAEEQQEQNLIEKDQSLPSGEEGVFVTTKTIYGR